MNKYIHRLILMTPIFMIALYGCARYEPPSEFVAPTYNSKTIPNPPIYPNKRLSSNAVKIPDKVIDFKEVQPFTKLYKIVWYEPNNIGFIGQGHTYIYSVESNRFNKVDDIIIKNNIEERFRNTQIEWVEDTSTLRQTAEWAGFLTQLLFTPLS